MLKILVIDDEYSVIEPLILLLESENFSVTWAKDGKEALKCISADSFDWVCTDIVMPEMDGIEFLNKVRETSKSIRFIAWSGATFIDMYLKVAKLMGAVKVIPKPFLPEDILNIIKNEPIVR
ncbi:MAG TPA: response regulator [Chitinispirillaceae bacterium]|nr:response regulator [Chitinispirillaceae bacterium]